MVAEQILQRLEAEFDSPPEQIRAVADLLAAGASPEFVALFLYGPPWLMAAVIAQGQSLVEENEGFV